MSAATGPMPSPRTDVINMATAPCRFGTVLVAATDKGICDIQLGECQDALIKSYYRSSIVEVSWVQDNERSAWLNAVLNLTEDPNHAFDYPLDIQGTPFQMLVWHALCQVPTGQTTTYGELAQAIGKPKAYRAVGAACGANRLALAIPCHRALKKGAGPLDYRWGANIKMQILAVERACSDLTQRDLIR